LELLTFVDKYMYVSHILKGNLVHLLMFAVSDKTSIWVSNICGH